MRNLDLHAAAHTVQVAVRCGYKVRLFYRFDSANLKGDEKVRAQEKAIAKDGNSVESNGRTAVENTWACIAKATGFYQMLLYSSGV